MPKVLVLKVAAFLIRSKHKMSLYFYLKLYALAIPIFFHLIKFDRQYLNIFFDLPSLEVLKKWF